MPYMLETMDTSILTAEEKVIFDQAQSWNYNNDIDEVGPSIWRQWYGKLYNMVWDEFNVEGTALETPSTYQTIYLLKNKGEDKFMDIMKTSKTETAKDLFLLSFKEAATRLIEIKSKEGDYNWGNYKGTYAGHLLQGLPAFSRFDIPIGGGRNIVNATSENWGPSWSCLLYTSPSPRDRG